MMYEIYKTRVTASVTDTVSKKTQDYLQLKNKCGDIKTIVW